MAAAVAAAGEGMGGAPAAALISLATAAAWSFPPPGGAGGSGRRQLAACRSACVGGAGRWNKRCAATWGVVPVAMLAVAQRASARARGEEVRILVLLSARMAARVERREQRRALTASAASLGAHGLGESPKARAYGRHRR